MYTCSAELLLDYGVMVLVTFGAMFIVTFGGMVSVTFDGLCIGLYPVEFRVHRLD